METDLVLPNDAQRDRLYRLAATIETKAGVDPDDSRHRQIIRDGDAFAMQIYDFYCGTPACIAGWACWQLVEDGKATSEPQFSMEQLKEYLGLGADDAFELFTPMAPSRSSGEYDMNAIPGDPGHITPRHAAACIRHYAETGEVDWEEAKERERKDAAG